MMKKRALQSVLFLYEKTEYIFAFTLLLNFFIFLDTRMKESV